MWDMHVTPFCLSVVAIVVTRVRSPGTILSAQQPDARTSGRHRSTVSDRDGRESVDTVLLSYPVTSRVLVEALKMEAEPKA